MRRHYLLTANASRNLLRRDVPGQNKTLFDLLWLTSLVMDLFQIQDKRFYYHFTV